MTRPQDFITQQKPDILLIGVYAPYNPTSYIESYYEEFLNLARTNGIEPTYTMFIKLRQIDPGYFFTQGKLNEIAEYCSTHGIEAVVVSEPLNVQQERNLSELLRLPVIDRTGLILEIFERGAQSSEGKIQVAIAVLQYRKSRLAGRGIHMSQQAGMIGMRGPGETAKEREARHLENLINKYKQELKVLYQRRETQRKRRVTQRIPHICLIGYTNAGKSTILNALTKSNVLAEDKLFATLDTTTRELYIDSKKVGLISDTVGFIQQLPHTLIEAFKSTLSELQYADLLLHVIDISDPNWQLHIKVVMAILAELEIEKPMLYVFNKADKASEPLPLQLEQYQPHVVISALSPEGITNLKRYLSTWKPSSEQPFNQE